MGNNGVEHGDVVDDDAVYAVLVSAAVPPAPASGMAANGVGGAAAGDDVDVVRRFLREVGGVPEAIVDSRVSAGLVGYVQRRFAIAST